MFQQYLSKYSILEVETFRMYSYMIELFAHVRRSSWTYAGQPGRDIKVDFVFKFSFFLTCMGDPPRGDRQCYEL